MANRRRPRRGDPPRRGPRAGGRDRAAALERTAAAIAGMVDEATQHGVGRSPPSARPDCASRATAPTSSTAIQARTGVTVEVISGEEESRLAYLAVAGRPRARRGLARRLRHRRRQLAVHVRPRRERRRALQRRRRRRALHRALRARRAPCRAEVAARRPWRRSRPSSSRLDGRRSPTRCGDGRRGDEHHRGQASASRTYDPDVVQGTVLDRAEIDRQIELYRVAGRRRRAARSSACSRTAPRSSSPARASSARSWRSSASTSLTVSDRGLRHGVLARALRRLRMRSAQRARDRPR